MSLITSPEFYINVKDIPDITSKDYRPFFKEEKRKIKEGVTINGTRIPGWLYWHVNHWIINIDIEDPKTGYAERKTSTPYLRDNEWLISEHIEKAEKEKKGLLILGSRQLGKSEFGASYMGRRCISFQNSQNVIAGLSEPDLILLLSKIDKGFTSIHPFFRPIKITENWKTRISLGYKDTQGNRTQFSELLVRNLDGGLNTENLAGPTTSSLLLDEVGKGDFLEAYIAARPAIETPFGFRGSPIFVGTSGSFDKSEDLQKFRDNLEAYNFLEVEMKDYQNIPIHFIPGYQSSKSKRVKVRLSNYLKVKKGSELDDVAIHVVADPQEEIRKILHQRELLKEAGDFIGMKKETMYFPLNEEELFLIDDADNVFADIKEIAREQLAYLESIDNDEIYVWLTRDSETGKVKEVPAKPGEIPIQDYPTGEKENKDAPIIIWDRPIPGQQFGILHVAGTDPYNQDEAFYSPSLGTTYIYRRMYDPLRGVYQNRFVACYAARPKTIAKWREQVRLLLEYYQATCLPENEEPGFIRWFDDKNIIHYLEDGLDLAKEINPNTTVKRKKGLSASTANIRYGNGLLKNYFNEDLTMGQDAQGEPIIKKGVIRIKDKLLLKEVIAYKPGVGKKKASNVDRIVAARHALILATMKDKYFPLAKVDKPQDTKKEKPHTIKSPFNMHQYSSFGKRKSNPFKLS